MKEPTTQSKSRAKVPLAEKNSNCQGERKGECFSTQLGVPSACPVGVQARRASRFHHTRADFIPLSIACFGRKHIDPRPDLVECPSL